MKLKSVFGTMSAIAMLVAPAAAQAGTVAGASVGKVASLSNSGVRQSTSIQKKQKQAAGLSPLLILGGVAATGLAVYGLVEIVDDGGSSGD